MQSQNISSNNAISKELVKTIQTKDIDSVLTDRERQEAADRLLAEQLQKEEQPSENEYKQPDTINDIDNSEWRVEQNNLLETLTNINSNESKSEQQNTWATDYGIRVTLEHYIGQHAYIVDPRLSSISSPLDRNAERASAGAINYAKMLSGYSTGNDAICNGILHLSSIRPIVMILNTDSVITKSQINGQIEGGQHWVACIVLPANYTTPAGTAINNQNTQIYFIDSYYNSDIPQTLRNALTQQTTDQVTSDVQHVIAAPFPNAQIKKYGAIQQKNGSDCGWWAVYNAIMVVLTGNADFLQQFKQPSREPAYALRYLFPQLTRREHQPISQFDHQIDRKKTQLYGILRTNKPASKNRTKEKYYTNLLAIIVVAIGALIAFGSNLIPNLGTAIDILITGLVIGGVGLLPRIGVSLMETFDTADKEKASKKTTRDLITKIKHEKEAELVKQYQLDKSYRSKWLDLGLNILTALLGYTTTAAIAFLIKQDQLDAQKKAESTTESFNNQTMLRANQTMADNQSGIEFTGNLITRYSLTGTGIFLTALLSLIIAKLDYRATQRQQKLDKLKEELQEISLQKDIEEHYNETFAEVSWRLGVDKQQAKLTLQAVEYEQAEKNTITTKQQTTAPTDKTKQDKTKQDKTPPVPNLTDSKKQPTMTSNMTFKNV